MTTKKLAAAANVSERMIYMAGAVWRLRPDLEPAIMAGKMSVNEAYNIAKNKKPRTKVGALLSLWNSATHDERMAFLAAINEDRQATA